MKRRNFIQTIAIAGAATRNKPKMHVDALMRLRKNLDDLSFNI